MSRFLPYLSEHFSVISSQEDAVHAQIDAALSNQSSLYVAHHEMRKESGDTLSTVFVVPADKKDGLVSMSASSDAQESLTVYQFGVPGDIRQSVAESAYSDLMKKRALEMAS